MIYRMLVVLALLPAFLMVGCSTTVGDTNPYTKGSPLGDQRIGLLTSVASSFEPVGEDADGNVIWASTGVQTARRDTMSGIVDGSRVFANVALPAAALKFTFDPATQKHRIDETGTYTHNVNGRFTHHNSWWNRPITPNQPGPGPGGPGGGNPND